MRIEVDRLKGKEATLRVVQMCMEVKIGVGQELESSILGILEGY
ncbi:hypothetical protein [Bacillus sp. V2I10]|nr:hypothetical protein [Bacillus sp. V2I10]MDQ0861296.1 hypothetical protein [Bacillus sp. V2I10]